jgi:transposase
MKESGTAIMVRDQVKLQDKSISQVAREMNMSRNTVKKYLKEGEKEDRRKGTKRGSKLDAYKDDIEELMSLGIYNAVVIYERIVEKGFDGKITILKDYLKPLRPVTIKEGPAVRRYETKAGSQVQMDWGICKYLDPCNQIRKVACFVMVLGFSRVRYVEFCKRCDLGSLLRCCVNAFEYFGGVPEVLLTDHMKTVITQVDHGQAVWQEEFQRFATDLGFVPKVCRVRRPQTKGKVERLVQYVKRNFMPGRTFIDLDDLNAQARHWMTIANSKVHGTTGQIPLLQLLLEGLKELPQDGRHLEYTWEHRKVSNDGFVSYDGVRYGVKWLYCGQVLRVKQVEQKLYLENYEGEIVQVHDICRTSRKYVYALGQYDGLLLAEGQPKPPAYGLQIGHAEVAIRNLTDYAAFAGGF